MASFPSLPRTDWFKPDVDPTIVGDYECSTTGDDKGYIFTRRWNGKQWVSSVTFLPTTVRMCWRGVQPGPAIVHYLAAQRVVLVAASRIPGAA